MLGEERRRLVGLTEGNPYRVTRLGLPNQTQERGSHWGCSLLSSFFFFFFLPLFLFSPVGQRSKYPLVNVVTIRSSSLLFSTFFCEGCCTVVCVCGLCVQKGQALMLFTLLYSIDSYLTVQYSCLPIQHTQLTAMWFLATKLARMRHDMCKILYDDPNTSVLYRTY